MNKAIHILLFPFISLAGCQHNDVQPQTDELDLIKQSLTTQVDNQQKIQLKQKPILEFMDEFTSDDRDLVQQVEIYKLDRLCVATTLFQNESGFGGNDGVVVFSGNGYKYGFERQIYQVYKPGNGDSYEQFTGKFKYDAEITHDTNTIVWQKQSIRRWQRNNFTNSVKKACLAESNKTSQNLLIKNFYGKYKFDDYQTEKVK